MTWKSLVLLLGLASVASLAMPAKHSVQVQRIYQGYLYAEPSTSSKKLRRLWGAEIFQAQKLNYDRSWVYVEDDAGLGGWLPRRSIEAMGPAAILNAKLSKYRFYDFEASLGIYQSRIDAVDRDTLGKGSFSSVVSPQFNLAWKYEFFEGFGTLLGGHFRYENFDSDADSQTFTKDQQYLFGLRAGFVFFPPYSRYRLQSTVALEEESFARADSLTSIRMQKLIVPKAKFGFSYDFYRRMNAYHLGVLTSFDCLGARRSEEFNAEAGYSYGTGLRYTQFNSQTPFFVSILFKQNKQNTTISRQVGTYLGLEMGFLFLL